MALSTCKECNGKVSTLAKTCPHCGVTKPATIIKKKSKRIIKPWGDVMDIMCANVHCTAWLNPVNVPKKKLSLYKCPRCNQGMKTYSERVAEDDRRRIQSRQVTNENQNNKQSRIIDNNNSNSSSPKDSDSAWDKFLDGKYLIEQSKDNKFELPNIANKIINGYNQNEVILVPKNLKNKGFFENFFQLFS